MTKASYVNLTASDSTPEYKGVPIFDQYAAIWYISETVTDRGIFTIEDEYKVVCSLSNSAAFVDLQWPRTPVSRSQYSLKANISQMVHQIHSMFCSRLEFSGMAELMVQLLNFKNPRWRYTHTAVARNPCVSWAFLFNIGYNLDTTECLWCLWFNKNWKSSNESNEIHVYVTY